MADRPYTGVRALERGLELLEALGACGRAKPGELARMTGLDRTTVYRLLETLRRRGFTWLDEAEGDYRLTVRVRMLGDAFQHVDDVCRIVAPELGRLLPHVVWPSDFATFERGTMTIRETTHRFSPYSVHRSMIGRTRPLTKSALGRAVLSASSEEQRRLMLDLAIATGQADGADARDVKSLGAVLAEVDRLGYAWSVDGSEVGISAIALPIRSQSLVLGAINLIFFTRAMTPAVAAKRHLARMRRTVGAIESRIRDEGLFLA